jgi:putative redox protein
MQEKIEFANAYGEKLVGTLHRTANRAIGGIVFGHCFTCSRHTTVLRRVCTDLADAGFLALRFDFSGNGQSEGAFSASTYTRQSDEMHTAAKILEAQGVQWLGMGGHSMGAGVAFLAASRSENVRAVCCMAGRFSGTGATRFLSPGQRDELEMNGRVIFNSRGRKLEMTRDFFRDAGQYSFLKLLKECTTAILVVHGDKDDIVPVAEAHLAADTNPECVEKVIIKDADHMFSNAGHLQQLSQSVVAWFSDRRNTDK